MTNLPKRGDIVFYAHEDYGVGCVKESNEVDKVLVEFGTEYIDSDEGKYIAKWFNISDLLSPEEYEQRNTSSDTLPKWMEIPKTDKDEMDFDDYMSEIER